MTRMERTTPRIKTSQLWRAKLTRQAEPAEIPYEMQATAYERPTVGARVAYVARGAVRRIFAEGPRWLLRYCKYCRGPRPWTFVTFVVPPGIHVVARYCTTHHPYPGLAP